MENYQQARQSFYDALRAAHLPADQHNAIAIAANDWINADRSNTTQAFCDLTHLEYPTKMELEAAINGLPPVGSFTGVSHLEHKSKPAA